MCACTPVQEWEGKNVRAESESEMRAIFSFQPLLSISLWSRSPEETIKSFDCFLFLSLLCSGYQHHFIHSLITLQPQPKLLRSLKRAWLRLLTWSSIWASGLLPYSSHLSYGFWDAVRALCSSWPLHCCCVELGALLPQKFLLYNLDIKSPYQGSIAYPPDVR